MLLIQENQTFLFIVLSTYPSLIVPVNFAGFVIERGKKSSWTWLTIQIESIWHFFFFSFFFVLSSFSFCGMRNRQRHGANLRPIVGPAIVGLMKGAFKSLFSLNCFASAFQRCILSPALHETIAEDETLFLPFFRVQMSNIK